MKKGATLIGGVAISAATMLTAVVLAVAIPRLAQADGDPIREPAPGIELLYHTWGFDGPPKLRDGWAELWEYEEEGAVDDDFLRVTRWLGDYQTFVDTDVLSEEWSGVMDRETADWELDLVGSGSPKVIDIWDGESDNCFVAPGEPSIPGAGAIGSGGSIDPTFAGKAYALLPSKMLGQGKRVGIHDLFYTISVPSSYWITLANDVGFISKGKAVFNGANTQFLTYQGVNTVDFGELCVPSEVFGFPSPSDRWFKTTAVYDLKTGIMLVSVIAYGKDDNASGIFPDVVAGEWDEVFRIETRELEEINEAPVALPAAFAADTDGDGLSDGLEHIIGTNPNDPDTDGDETEDGEEVQFTLTDPRNPAD